MTRRSNTTKHPALLRKEVERTTSVLLGADVDLRVSLAVHIPRSVERLMELINGENLVVALNAIKHLHVITGVGVPEGSPIIQNMVQTEINMFGAHDGEPPTVAHKNGKVVDAK